MSEPEQTPAQRRAAQRRAAAGRARAYREKLKAEGIPESRDIDAALSEALSFALARNGVNIGIDAVKLMRSTRLILERNGFDPKKSAVALAERLTSRPEHSDADFVPSHRPGPADRVRETKAGPWKTPIATVMAHFDSI
jgi:hypothetical protein